MQNLGIEKVKTKDLLEAFAMARKLNMQLLARLPEGALDRVGLHGERGEESIRTMLTMYAGHDLIHERQIAAAIADLRERKKRGKRTPDDATAMDDGARNGTAEKRKADKKSAKKARKRNASAGVPELLPS